MFERHHEKLLSRPAFLRRVVKYALIALGFILISLLAGVIGYHQIENMPWIDAFLNAAMLMGGMGPVGTLQTDAGKLFAGIYALYCGMVLLIAVGIAAAPIAHRFLHYFHLSNERNEEQSS